MPEEVLHPAVTAIALAALGEARGPDAPGAVVPRDEQQGLLAELLERSGPDGVLLAGRHLDAVAGEPLVLALLNSDDPAVLLDKVDRLNRYVHSHHRHRVHHLGDRSMELEHVSLGGSPPTPLESLFVCGLYLALLERTGGVGVGCAFPEAPTGGRDVYREGRPERVPTVGTRRWRITWARLEAPRVLPGLDEVVLRDLPADLSERPCGARVAAIVGADLSRSWRLDDLAPRLAMSPRTLQRRLGTEGRPFRRIVCDVRVAAAKRLLGDGDRTVTDIGYVTGFADTAHFTRTFKAETGLTPTAWRARSGPPPSPSPRSASRSGTV